MPLGHIGVNVSAFGGAKAYFDELMPMLTFEPFVVTEGQFSYRPGGGKPGTHIFFYSALETGGYSRHKPGLQHLAFIVESRALVHQVHEWARARGDEVIPHLPAPPAGHGGAQGGQTRTGGEATCPHRGGGVGAGRDGRTVRGRARHRLSGTLRTGPPGDEESHHG